MEKKTLLFLLSALLLLVFFVPFVHWDGFTMSGFDLVVSEHTPPVKYLLIVLPATALYILFTCLGFETDIHHNKFIMMAPLTSIIAVFGKLIFDLESRELLNINPLDVSSIGFWIAITISAILALLSTRNRYRRTKFS